MSFLGRQHKLIFVEYHTQKNKFQSDLQLKKKVSSTTHLKLRETHNSIENVDGEEMRAQPKEGKTKLKKEERKWIR